ncbi:MAG: hypothetical protein XD36_0936 [Halomonas sp. 54_146]|nr:MULTISPECIES: hypothetical protein [unclassified Halomonas]KUJ88699.1 MAG: hypothetical protein XD36_0936 [Halomonas sp. 54_146]HAA44673.1 hypothetical protein [Halomonas sp.]
MAKKPTDLKTAAVQLDTLADPRLAAEGQRLLALLDKHAADMAKAPRRARMALLLSENKGSVTNVLADLRLKVEGAEKLKEAVGKEDGRLQRQKKTLDDALHPTTTALMNRAGRLKDEKLGLEQRIKQMESQHLKAIKQLAEAGLTCEEAESRAKPSRSDIQKLTSELHSLPFIGDQVQWRLGSYVHRLKLQEQSKTPRELTA